MGSDILTKGYYTSNVRKVLIYTLILNSGVALAKVLYGYITNSIAMTSDGFHSFFDGISNVIGLIGIWIASHPPDEKHPYGHKKYETFFSLGIGVLIFLIAFNLFRQAIIRLYNPVTLHVHLSSFLVMIITLCVNFWVMHYEYKKVALLKSDILKSDAHHTRSDILTSLSVIISLVVIRAGFPIIDPIAALLISLFITHAGYVFVLQWHAARRITSLWDLSRCMRYALRSTLVFFLSAFIIAAPLIIYLTVINPSAEARVADLSGPLTQLRAGNPGEVIASTLNTLGMFTYRGDAVPIYNVSGLPVFPEIVGAALFVIGLSICLWRWKRPAYALILLWFFISLIPAMVTPFSPNFVRTIASWPTPFVFVGLAMSESVQWVIKRQSAFRNPHLVVGAFVVILGYNALLTARDEERQVAHRRGGRGLALRRGEHLVRPRCSSR